MMTQPKFQNLLLNCDLPLGESAALRNSKIVRKYSDKSGKDGKNNSFESTAKSFNVHGFRSRTQDKSTKNYSRRQGDSIN